MTTCISARQLRPAHGGGLACPVCFAPVEGTGDRWECTAPVSSCGYTSETPLPEDVAAEIHAAELRRLPVPAWWRAFCDAPEAPNARAARWLERRLGPELAEALTATSPPLFAAPEPGPAWLRGLGLAGWSRLWRRGYALAVPTRAAWGGPHVGEVVDVKLRWCLDAPAPNDAKGRSLRSDHTKASGLVRVLGDPLEVTADAEGVVLCEGEADFLALEALRLSGRLPAGWVPIGLAMGAGQGRQVGEALGAHLAALADEAADGRRWRVVLAADADRAGDDSAAATVAAMRRMEAPADLVRPDWPAGSDVCDRLKAIGADALAGELVEAGAYQQPRTPAAQGSVPMAEARAALASTVKDRLARTLAGENLLVCGPPGVGKTHVALALAVDRARGADWSQICLVVPNWKLAEDHLRTLHEIEEKSGVTAKVHKLQGVGEGCHFKATFKAEGRPDGWREVVCRKCPRRSKCRVNKPPPAETDLVISVHAMLPHLPTEMAGRFIIALDEAQNPVITSTWRPDDLARWDDATYGAPDGADAADTLRHAARAMAEIVAVLRPAALERYATHHPVGTRKYGRRIVAECPDRVHTWLEALDAGAAVRREDMPEFDPTPIFAGSKLGDKRAALRRDTPKLCSALAEGLRAALEDREPDEDAVGFLTLVYPAEINDGRGWAWELRRPAKLPEGFGALCLDATGGDTPHIHKAVLGAGFETITVNAAPVPESRKRLAHYPTSRSLSRRALCDEHDVLTDKGARTAASLLRHAMTQALALTSEGWSARKALIAMHRPIVAAIGEKADAQGLTGGWEVLRITARAIADEVSLVYYGGQDRGSNAFNDVDLVITLGDPWPDLGSSREDQRAIGCATREEADERIGAEVAATLKQAQGRGRFDTRAGAFVGLHLGAVKPAGWTRDNSVTLTPRKQGGQARPDALDWRALLAEIKAVLGFANVPLLRRLHSATDPNRDPLGFMAECENGGNTGLEAILSRFATVRPDVLPDALPSDRTMRRLLGETFPSKVGSTRDRLHVAEGLTEADARARARWLEDALDGRDVGPMPAASEPEPLTPEVPMFVETETAAPAPVAPAAMTADQLDAWDERVAIVIAGGLTREELAGRTLEQAARDIADDQLARWSTDATAWFASLSVQSWPDPWRRSAEIITLHTRRPERSRFGPVTRGSALVPMAA